MSATGRRSIVGGLLLIAALGAGCNVLSLPFFIFGPEPKIPARLKKIASEEKDKEVKVLILAYSPLITALELLRPDRDLSILLAQHLKARCEYNKEKVKIISSRKVEDYKQQHPDWHKQELEEIGKHFEADYVIYLEIASLSLYEKGSNNLLYRGHAEIDVTLIDVNKTDDTPNDTRSFTSDYPTDYHGGAIPADNSSWQDFRTAFYHHIARQLSWYFTSHPTREDYRDGPQS